MAHGFKSGGRLKGTPNRRTQDLQTQLERLGCDPFEGMARIAMDPESPVEVRARMFAELAQYIAPKRKAIQVDTGEANRVVFNIGIDRRMPLHGLNTPKEPLTLEA
ncbi:MAG: hypothetical protein FJY39_11230 [Betaproteobacteria bacterium]|nr:hypothetical protein [Betaproteobacteria bacterium]